MNTQAISYIQQGQYLQAARMLVHAVQAMTSEFSRNENNDSHVAAGVIEQRRKQQERMHSCWLQAEKICFCNREGDQSCADSASSCHSSNASLPKRTIEDPSTSTDNLIYSYALDLTLNASDSNRLEDKARTTVHPSLFCCQHAYGHHQGCVVLESDKQVNRDGKYCEQDSRGKLFPRDMHSSHAVSCEMLEPFLYAIHLYNAGLAFQLHGLESKKSAFIVTAKQLYEMTLTILLSDPHCASAAACQENPLQNMYLRIVLAVANNLAVICLDYFDRNTFLCARQLMSECLTLIVPSQRNATEPINDSSTAWAHELSFFYLNLVLEFQQSFSVAPCA